MATASGSVSTTTRNPRHWQLAVLVMATLPEITTSFGHRARSLDHLVGAGEQRRWNFQTESIRSVEVDDQLKLGRLLDRKFGRLRPAENLVDILASAAKQVRDVGPI